MPSLLKKGKFIYRFAGTLRHSSLSNMPKKSVFESQSFVDQLALKPHGTKSDEGEKAASKPRGKKSKLFDAHIETSVWFKIVKPLKPQNGTKQVPEDKVDQSYSAAKNLLESEKSGSSNSSHSDRKMLQNMLRSGTLSDKVAAMTLAVQDSPLHQLEQLEALIALANKRSQRESGMAIEALTDLFINNLLPDRKLHYFRDQLHGEVHRLGEKSANVYLSLWYFEDRVKHFYAELLRAIETASKDNLLHQKRLAMNCGYELLSSKPEQEKMLLLLLVNKVGDPDRKIAAKAGFLLQQLMSKHPAMKTVVVQEVQRFVNRPNIPQKALYFAVLLLNQIYLTVSDELLAANLIQIYFSLFGKYANGHGVDIQQKLLGSLLSGVNRAFPYTQSNGAGVEEHTAVLFRLVHQTPFNTGVQALMLLLQVMTANSAVSSRFYCALYSQLLHAELPSSSKQLLFLNLVYRALKADTVPERIHAFVKRLLQVSIHCPAHFAAGSLFLISEFAKVKKSLKALIFQPEHQKVTHDSTKDEEPVDEVGGYDPQKRNPSYASASSSCLWELNLLSSHYHPSVSQFATSLLKPPHSIEYRGDPLQDFTLSAFLDRFSYRNPKKKDASQQGMRKKQNDTQPLVNSNSFLKQVSKDIRHDEMFFHKFFQEKQTRSGGGSSKRQAADSSWGDDEEDEEEAFAQNLAEGMMRDYAEGKRGSSEGKKQGGQGGKRQRS
jgi:ribosome biogenesis protein MAK21